MKLGLVGLSLAVLIGIFFVVFGRSSVVTNVPSDGTSIVAFGDSLVAGVGSTAGNDWVSVVSTRVEEPIVNLGKSGDTTRDALLRIDAVLEQDPKVVLVLLGGNDYLQDIPEAETFANLETIIQAIHEAGAAVVLIGVRGGIIRDNYKSEFATLADTHRTAHISDILDGLITNSDLMADRVHPNDAGYQIIADRITPVLRQLLIQ